MLIDSFCRISGKKARNARNALRDVGIFFLLQSRGGLIRDNAKEIELRCYVKGGGIEKKYGESYIRRCGLEKIPLSNISISG